MGSESDISDTQLEAAIWYVKHKILLKRLVLGAIIAVDTLLVIFAVFGFGKDLAFLPKRRMEEFELLTARVSWSAARSDALPASLELGGVELLRVGEVADIVARVRNSNSQWYAQFDYTIGIGDQIENRTDGFLLPEAERILLSTVRGQSGTLTFNVENIRWTRVNPREIPDFETWRDDRLRFETKNSKFLPAAISEGGKTVSRASFMLINNTAFGYQEPEFLVLLYKGSRLAAVQKVVLERFTAGQQREVEVSWFDNIGAVSNIEVVPVIDIFDPGVYLKP